MNKITLQELLDHSFVITINDERFDNFCKVFQEHGLNSLPKRFNGFMLPNNIYKDIGLIKTSNICNCSFSHAAIIKTVEALDWSFVCIFEDDAYPHKDIINKLQNILSNIPDDVDMIKLGYLIIKNKNDLNILNNKLFYSNAKTTGSHAYIIFKKYYSIYQKIFNKNATADLLLMNSKNNILTVKDNLFVQYNLCDSYDKLHNTNIFLKNCNLNNFNI
jgi:GR25 family glycosyltransferase involved in LPS biosynthesis